MALCLWICADDSVPGNKSDSFCCLQVCLRSLKLPWEWFVEHIVCTGACSLRIIVLPVDDLRCHQYKHGPLAEALEMTS